MNGVVLVLNQNYEPLNVCNLPRAFRLVFGEKAEVIEYDHQVIRTPRTEYHAPSVIRLQYQVKRPRPRVKLSRREIFARDRHTCQYCGRQGHDLTLDHIVPRHRGGGHTWENLVTACKACNHRKGGKTLDEARFRLNRPPFEPRSDVYSMFTPYLADPNNEPWRTYLFLGRNLSDSVRGDEAAIAAAVPTAVRAILGTLWSNGRAAYIVGGGPRDVLAGRTPASSWDLATSALPEETAALLADAVYENRFGTVVVRRDGVGHEITTFRSDHDYADFRRPHRVEFTGSIEADLARRDFAMNALAWGAEASREAGNEAPRLLDLHGGRADIAARLIRAVGEPRARFEEDALRILRAIRFAATLGFTIEPATLEAIHATAPLVAHLSGERIAMELTRILAAERPSVGLRLLAATGVLAAISPELAAQRGVEQSKVAGEDLWDHTLRTVDAAAARRPAEEPRWAALLHDIGKPATAADGHFYRHDSVGAEQAGDLLDRLHVARATRDRVVHLVRQHMFRYEPNWSDAAVRRFLAKVGPAAVEDLFALRKADNAGSGLPRDAEDLTLLRGRVAEELARGPLLDRTALAIDGRDLISELGLAEGPVLGRVIDALFERVVEDPTLNQRGRLLELAREIVAGDLPA